MTEGQQRALDMQWKHFGLSLQAGSVNLEKIFGNTNPVVVEIGFGMGDSLLNMAVENPGYNFIGIEVHLPGVGHLLNEAGKLQITNLRIYCADALDILSKCIPQHALARVQLFFPDPWPKKRHHKRRIVQPAFVELVASRLKQGGIFHLCTDWEPYAEHMLQVLASSDELQNTTTKFATKPSYRPETKFEKRGIKLGHGVYDLVFSKG